MSNSQMTVEEAAQRFIGAILVEFKDRDDDDLIPARSFFEEFAKVCNVRDFDGSDIPEWETMGWLRERARASLTRLAEGESIP